MAGERRRVPVDGGGARPAPEPESCDCPRLDRDEWHEVESDWSDIVFARIVMPVFLGAPLRFWRQRRKLVERAEAAGTVPEDAMLLLGPGRLRRTALLEVEDADASGRGLVAPGGVAWTRLAPAPWGRMRALMAETKRLARERYGRDPDTVWVWYLTCRVCSPAREFETLFAAHYRRRPAG